MKDDFLDRLVTFYWPPKEFERMEKEIGKKFVQEKNWRAEACYAFVCCNIRACEKIFNRTK